MTEYSGDLGAFAVKYLGVASGNASIKDLCFGYGSNTIFQGFSLELGNENPVAILGPSGCGKTTLLFLLAGILKPSAGEVTIGGGSPQSAAAMVFQEPRLLPWMNVLENVALPIGRLLGKKEALDRALRFLELVGLRDKARSFPTELSGGQQQRVSLARAFAFPRPVILLDEPFQSLDIPLRIQMMDLVLDLLAHESGRLVIAVTHDPREAVYLGRRIIVLGGTPGEAAGVSSGIVFDETLALSAEERAYGSVAQGGMERRLLAALTI
ncbi:MAG: ABC transporter ATP-binding protein [Treponema sp.]|jgi:NitT/TauT family transport system ATP-binding protein|nr:ABC transporter ATP-binding protein [Treponema sp.]